MNDKIMKELQAFEEKRAAMLAEQEAKIEALKNDIETLNHTAIDAFVAGDSAAYSAALKQISNKEIELKVVEGFKEVENYTKESDKVVLGIWEKYSAAYTKTITPKIKALEKARADLLQLYMDIVTIQAEAARDRSMFIRNLSKDPEAKSLVVDSTRLPLLPEFSAPNWDTFVKMFADDLGDQARFNSDVYNVFQDSRRV